MGNFPRGIGRVFRGRNPLIWWATATAVAIAVLAAATWAVSRHACNADWYTGIGQWLGALASFIAAAAALTIASTDRRDRDTERQRAEAQQEADLARQAGLVRVTAGMLGRVQPVGPSYPHPSISIHNRRPEPICEIAVTKFVHNGRETPLEPRRVNGYAFSPKREGPFATTRPIASLALVPNEAIVIYQQDSLPGTADYVAVQYTDTAGHRWQVDTKGLVTRL